MIWIRGIVQRKVARAKIKGGNEKIKGRIVSISIKKYKKRVEIVVSFK